MITHEEYNKAIKIVIDYKKELKDHYKEVSLEVEKISKFRDVTKDTILRDCDLSVRLHNILREQMEVYFLQRKNQHWGEIKVKELSGLSISKFLSFKRAGKASLLELKELCFYAGVDLKP